MTADRPTPVSHHDARLVAGLLKARGCHGSLRGARIVVTEGHRIATIDLEDWCHRYWMAGLERVEDVTRGTEWADALADQVAGWLRTGTITYPEKPRAKR